MKKRLTDTDRSNPIKSVEMTDKQQDARNAFNNLKNAFRGLKESTDELVEEFEMLNQTAKANGGKIPDVNEILRTVLAESDEGDDGR